MRYIINMVAIPRIEYKAQLTVFNHSKASSLMVKLRRLMRSKIGVINTLHNDILQEKEIYPIIDFYERQAASMISALQLKLNDKDILGLTTEIRLRKLQSDEWLYTNPTTCWAYNN